MLELILVFLAGYVAGRLRRREAQNNEVTRLTVTHKGPYLPPGIYLEPVGSHDTNPFRIYDEPAETETDPI